FLRQTVALAGIAGDTRANNVFPSGLATAVARHDVIEVKLAAVENVTAILAGIFVALEDIVPGKLHFFLRQPVKKQKNNDAWHPNFPRDGSDNFLFRGGGREIAPAFEIMRQKIICIIRRHDVGVAGVNQRERATRRTDVDRLPKAVQDQNLTVK
ncbi:MAG: hypothetical protein JWO45_1, partial [Spartobacteria bacterium]|nr:hypothetical protein [Spartobacteria bacterium]